MEKESSRKKNPRVKISTISFTAFWTLLDAAFNKPPNTTFERYKLLNHKQKDRESYEQFWRVLTDLASTGIIKENDEAEWIRDVFICNMRNTDTQRKLLSTTVSPTEALNQALVDERGYFNHQKLTVNWPLNHARSQLLNLLTIIIRLRGNQASI